MSLKAFAIVIPKEKGVHKREREQLPQECISNDSFMFQLAEEFLFQDITNSLANVFSMYTVNTAD